MKHTQNTWKLFVSNDAKPHNVFLGSDVGSVEIHHYGFIDKDGVISKQQLSNARLISAAPELLKALIEVIETRFNVADTQTRRRARAAIAKATGESNEL